MTEELHGHNIILTHILHNTLLMLYSFIYLYLYVREGYNAFNDYQFPGKGGGGDMGDKGGKKDKAKSAKQAKIKKDTNTKKKKQ